ncbi:hypothetical protein [Marnyiella aurantia]|uniref:Uncharacterized protein n=1 Tax=Marnyiella aurantia TaxID=2758037 RepID=A0A838ZB97_9FLAO|nr:hypothetical protein [Marnyiella aurantia]MBA5246265.1 hypothetical protein [Marnyiella aurantia]
MVIIDARCGISDFRLAFLRPHDFQTLVLFATTAGTDIDLELLIGHSKLTK